MYLKFFLIVLFLLVEGLSFAQPFSLNEDVTALLPNLESANLIWGDYDGDGDLDILQSGNDGAVDVLYLYKNENGSYAVVSTEFTSLGNSNISWNDFDNDNDLDIFYTGVDGNNIAVAIIYKNLGLDLFEEVNSEIIGVKSGETSWADLDNDGDQDLIMVGEKGDERITRMYRNNGNDSFENIEHDLLGFYKGDVDLGDYDNDLDMDVLLIGNYKDTEGIEQRALKLYRNDGNFFFTEINPGFIGMNESNVQWADYDADGDLDILANGSTEAPTFLVYLYKNQGNDNFLNIGIEIFGTVNGSVNWGDYDNDGDLDFLLSGMPSYGSEPITEIYRNIAEDLFNKENNQNLPGIYNSSTFWGDYDNDGDLDVIMTGQQSETGDFISAVYNNKNEFTNQLPSIPENIESEVEGATVLLFWDAATDSETISENLTYNVKMGSTSGASDIMSPMANQDGFKFVDRFGNTGYNTSFVIVNLSPGEYYWSVQAVDNNFAGSGFSEEGSFTIALINIDDIDTFENHGLKVYPNPFQNGVLIQLLKAEVKPSVVKIFNSYGNFVTEIKTDLAAGQIYWDGRDNIGQEVQPGIYFLYVNIEGQRMFHKLLKN